MTKPNSDQKKIKLKRDRYRPSFALLVVMGISVIFSGTYFLLPYLQVNSSDAENFTMKRKVGLDLLSTGSINKLTKNKERNDSGRNLVKLSSRDMSRVVPERSRANFQFNQTKTLDFVNHTVESGESLWSIANQYGLETYSVASVNYDVLTDEKTLPIGLELRIPNRNGVMTKLDSGQTLWDLKSTYNVPGEKILAFNNIEDASQLKRGQTLFIPDAKPVNPYKYRISGSSNKKFEWPVDPSRRRVTSRFGKRKHPVYDRMIFHRGIDIAAHKGTKVYAARSGVVRHAGKIKGYGKVITLKHNGGYKTLYGHLYRSFVNVGQYVEEGQAIGAVGNSGLATGSNLHFEVRKNNKAKNPLRYLP